MMPRFRLAHVAGWWVVGFLASNTAVVIYLVASGRAGLDDPLAGAPLSADAFFQAALWIGLAGGPIVLSRRFGRGSLAQDYGWTLRGRSIAPALGAGLLTQLVIIPILYIPIFWLVGDADLSEDARALTDRAANGLDVAVLVLVVVIGAPLVEELFFRGLLWEALRERGLSTGPAVAVTSVLFGVAHFQLLQLPALVAFGAVAAVLRARTGGLTAPIAAHVMFNAITVAQLLVLD